MRVLIVHDREQVAQEIATTIEALGIEGLHVKIVKDAVSASECLRTDVFDLMILDLTIPYVHGVMEPSAEVAEGLLRELFTLQHFNPPGDVIGMSLEPNALRTLAHSVGPHLMAMIEEDAGGLWKAYLSDRVKYALRASQWRQFSAFRHYDVDVLLVTALDEEMEPYDDHFDFVDFKKFPRAKSFGFRDKEGVARRGIAYSIGRSGQPRAASRTQSLLAVFRPRLAIMTGICGGFQGKAAAGELLIFETVYDWDYGKWRSAVAGPQRSEPMEFGLDALPFEQAKFVTRAVPISIDNRPEQGAARDLIASELVHSPDVLKRLEVNSGGEISRFEVSLAQVASGSAVVAHQAIVNQIVGLNDALRGVDMEAYGFYHAVQTTHVAAPAGLCIKAVSDHANSSKSDEIHHACAALSADAAVHLIRWIWDFND